MDEGRFRLRKALQVGEPGAEQARRVIERRQIGLVEPLEQSKGDAGVQARPGQGFVSPGDLHHAVDRQGKLADRQAADHVPGLGRASAS